VSRRGSPSPLTAAELELLARAGFAVLDGRRAWDEYESREVPLGCALLTARHQNVVGRGKAVEA
jgi:hypothetical protein